MRHSEEPPPWRVSAFLLVLLLMLAGALALFVKALRLLWGTF
jgi:hypothetical protein